MTRNFARPPGFPAPQAHRVYRAWRFLLIASIAVGWTPITSAATAAAEQALARLDFREVVKEAKARVFPTVVFLRCLREGMERGEKRSQEVSGSGVIISENGEILSNWHVVDNATEVRGLLFDGRAFPVKVIGTDKDTDVSLLQLQLPPGEKLAHARLGDSTTLTEGDFVMAMGAPFGLARSVSIGIISCTKRYLPTASEYSIWLQTDAAISPGNSGGPLVNTAGEVVGLNTRGIMSGGGDTGFTVPIEVARQVADAIRKHGRMAWSWTGVQLQPLKDFDRNVYFPATNGVLVAETDPESPARRAGLLAGDRIVSINGTQVTGMTQEDLPAIRRQLGLLPKDRPVELACVRQGKPVTVNFTPRAKGSVEGEQLDCPRWDFTVRAINQFDNPSLYFQRPEGVFIFGVKYPGNAAQAGLVPQDIVLKIDGREVKSLNDVRASHTNALANILTRHRAVFTVLRNGEFRQVVLDYSRQREKD